MKKRKGKRKKKNEKRIKKTNHKNLKEKVKGEIQVVPKSI